MKIPGRFFWGRRQSMGKSLKRYSKLLIEKPYRITVLPHPVHMPIRKKEEKTVIRETFNYTIKLEYCKASKLKQCVSDTETYRQMRRKRKVQKQISVYTKELHLTQRLDYKVITQSKKPHSGKN